jgi:hypothetical protein
VTLWWLPKSRKFGAILWLILADCDHDRIGICHRVPGSPPGFELYDRSLSPGLDGLSCQKVPKQLQGIRIQRAGYRNKLDDVDAALTAFVFGNKRLRPAQLFGQLVLPDVSSMSHCDKDFDQPGIFGRFE